jgi:hypothetical protein
VSALHRIELPFPLSFFMGGVDIIVGEISRALKV